jgi:hypothetical protein
MCNRSILWLWLCRHSVLSILVSLRLIFPTIDSYVFHKRAGTCISLVTKLDLGYDTCLANCIMETNIQFLPTHCINVFVFRLTHSGVRCGSYQWPGKSPEAYQKNQLCNPTLNITHLCAINNYTRVYMIHPYSTPDSQEYAH